MCSVGAGRRVNGGVSRVCAHAGRAMRCALRGVAGPGKGAQRARCRAFVRVQAARRCRRAECAGLWGPGPRTRGGGCVRPRSGCDPGRARGSSGCVLTRASRRGRRSGWAPAAGPPPAARTHLHLARPPAATPPLQCRRAPASEGRGAGQGLGRAGAVDRSCAAVRARSQEPAARSLALARSPARSLFNLK